MNVHNTPNKSFLTNLLDLWGFTSGKWFDWFVLFITGAMVLLEASFNLQLLNSLSDPGIDGGAANELSNRGKLLAAFGLAWVVGRGLISRIRPAIVGLLLFCVLVGSLHQALDWAYASAIANLRPEWKVKGYNLFVYRRDLLSGTVSDPDIPLPSKDPVNGRIIMGSFPIVLADDRYMLPASDIVARKADDHSKAALVAAQRGWPEYEKSMRELESAHQTYVELSRRATGRVGDDRAWQDYDSNMQVLSAKHREFVDASRRASDPAAALQSWPEYNASQKKVIDAHSQFIDGSKRALANGQRGIQRFREQSGGSDPDPTLSRAKFVELLRKSSHPKGEELRAAERRVVASLPDGSVVYGRDVPYFLSQADFVGWYQGKVKEAFKASGMEPNPRITRLDYVAALRESRHPSTEPFRRAEAREVGRRADGSPIRAGDVAYFMGKSDFDQWQAGIARETMQAKGLVPNADLSREGFVSLLRTTAGPDGERLRTAENRVLAKLPNGKPFLAGHIPYFMQRDEYLKWFAEQVQEVRAVLVPTMANVESFANIQEVNAAVFLPPMAIISSLTSALSNGIAFCIMLTSLLLTRFAMTISLGRRLRTFSVPLTLVSFITLIYVMPSHVFPTGTPLYELESELHSQVGAAARVWSKLSNLQRLVL